LRGNLARKKITTTMTCLPPIEKAERLIVGYSTADHLILDLDKVHSISRTITLIRMIQKEYPDVGDCLINESSLDGYHSIFDNQLSWKRIMQICRVLTGLFIVNRNFIAVRSFREDLTLRVSSIDRGREKSEAPRPTTLVLLKTKNASPYIQCNQINTIYGKKNFSGIHHYLLALSAFRSLDKVSVQIA
jgi:hypothetical protein